MYQLRRTANDFPVHVRLKLVQSLIFPNFEYAAVALCDLRSGDLARLQKVQNAVCVFCIAAQNRWTYYTCI